jgi:hypothetical protein
MKREEALLKLQRYYSIRHVMVEQNYITPDDFMAEVLDLVEELGFQPPFSHEMHSKTWRRGGDGHQWDEE